MKTTPGENPEQWQIETVLAAFSFLATPGFCSSVR
jgi:hypothetical protein